MDIFTVTLIISVLIFVAVGNYAGRGVKELDDYLVAGRRAPSILILGTLVASVFSSTIFMGEAGFTYAGQMGPYLLFPGLTATGYVYGALLFGRYLRRSRATTVAEYFGERFNSRRMQQISGVIIILALGVYLLVVTQGAALLLEDLAGISYTQGLVLAWLSYTVFTLYSGSRGVILTDTLMFLLFAVATIAFGYYVVDDLGGLFTTIESMTGVTEKPDIASWHGTVGEGTEWATPLDYLIWVIVIDGAWSVVYAVSPWQASRHMMARDEHVVVRAAILTCISVIILQFFIYGVGGFINLYNPDIDPVETVMIWAARNVVPDFLGALLLAGIIAAALSSASTFLSLIGFSASKDISPQKEDMSLKMTRIITAVVSAVALIASFFFPPNIFWLMLFVGTVFTSSWGPVALMSVWSKKLTESAAYWGMITGFIFNVVPSALKYVEIISFPHYLGPTIIGLAASLLTIFYLSAKTEVTDQEKDYRQRLHETPSSDRDQTKTKWTEWAAYLLVAYGVVMPFLAINLYVVPYQTGTGEILADGSVNWATGEAIMALSTPFLYVPLGLFALKIIRRDYGAR